MDEEKIVEATLNESKKMQEVHIMIKLLIIALYKERDDELQQVLEMSKADYFAEEHPESVKEVRY